MINKIFLYCIVSLAVGAGIGYVLATPKIAQNVHVMPDGTMMSDASVNSIEHSMSSMMAGLQGKTGDAFDKAFLEEMIIHHEGAVEMAEALLQNTKRPELQELGSDIISAQTGEIQMMQGWLRDWFPG